MMGAKSEPRIQLFFINIKYFRSYNTHWIWWNGTTIEKRIYFTNLSINSENHVINSNVSYGTEKITTHRTMLCLSLHSKLLCTALGFCTGSSVCWVYSTFWHSDIPYLHTEIHYPWQWIVSLTCPLGSWSSVPLGTKDGALHEAYPPRSRARELRELHPQSVLHNRWWFLWWNLVIIVTSNKLQPMQGYLDK